MLSPSSSPVAHAEPQMVLDALQQRLNKYREAGIQARASGDERKARMHERIAKVGLQPGNPPVSAPLSGCLLSALTARVSICLSLLCSCCLRGFFLLGLLLVFLISLCGACRPLLQ